MRQTVLYCTVLTALHYAELYIADTRQAAGIWELEKARIAEYSGTS